MSAFTLGGVVFVVDKMGAGKQPIWVLDRAYIRAYLDTENLEYHVYTLDMGRNSNLQKLPSFGKGHLLRIFPAHRRSGDGDYREAREVVFCHRTIRGTCDAFGG